MNLNINVSKDLKMKGEPVAGKLQYVDSLSL